MKGGKTSAKEKLWITLLSVGLWIELILLGLAIGFDSWIRVPLDIPSGSASEDQQSVVGLWKACLIPATKGTYSVTSYHHSRKSSLLS